MDTPFLWRTIIPIFLKEKTLHVLKNGKMSGLEKFIIVNKWQHILVEGL